MTDEELRRLLACPYDSQPLTGSGDRLGCPGGHEFPVYRGIPVLLREDVRKTIPWQSFERVRERRDLSEGDWAPSEDQPVHPAVQRCVGAAGGSLYAGLSGKLRAYPIPEIRLAESTGELLLDVGCNWGRWSIAAARKGYRVVAVEPDVGLALTAQVVARQLQAETRVVVADARYLPFASQSFDRVFSYSVIQHFSKEDARLALGEVGRVLKPAGNALIQMPNKFGLRSAYHQLRARFRAPRIFDVRYWSPRELLGAFESGIGPSRLSVDGFFGLGIQPSDWRILPRRYWPLIAVSEMLRASGWFNRCADSLYISSVKR